MPEGFYVLPGCDYHLSRWRPDELCGCGNQVPDGRGSDVLSEDADDLCGSQDLLSEDCHGLSGPVHNLPEPRDILCGRGRHGLSEPAHRVCGASHPLPASPNLLPCFPDPVSCRWRTGYGLPVGKNPVPPGGYRLPVWPDVLRSGADCLPGF